MKVLLYSEGMKLIGKSGLGRAIKHQIKALESKNIPYTLNPKDDYDVLHINTFWPKSYFFAKKAKKQGKRIIYHAHSTEEDFRNSFKFSNLIAPLFKKWLIKVYSLGDEIITPTPYSKKLLEGYGLKAPITAISNGINLSEFYYNEDFAKEFRDFYGYKKEDKIIMSVGIYIERKGILDFVELAKRMPEYQFIWFGYLDLFMVPHKIRKAVNTKLPNLKFAGYVKPEFLRKAYSGVDLFLFPTFEETEGIVLLEALATKQNVLVRDIPIYQDWFKENSDLYKAKDINEMEIKIKQIINKEVPSLVENGYLKAKEKDINLIGAMLEKVYIGRK